MSLRDYQLDLYNKTKQAFIQGKRRPLVVAPCGAGKSYIFLEMAKHCSGQVLVLTHRRELLQQHRRLAEQLGLNNVRFEMVITERNHLVEHDKPHLLIVDEAHLSHANTWVSVVQYYDTFTVGFTATPIRLDGKPLNDVYDCMIQGVDVSWLIQHNYLAPFKYYAPVEVDVSNIRISKGDFSVSDLEYLMGNRAIYGDIISSVKSLCSKCRQILAYCVSLNHAQQVCDMLNNAGITSDLISSKMNCSDRVSVMNRFRNREFRVLCNVGIVSEGISLDTVDCCLLLRPTMSHALYWQQAMRCMRYQRGKEAIILDFVGNYARNPLPDETVTWNLSDTSEKKPRLNNSGDFNVRVCSNCYRTFKTATHCPYCGNVYLLHQKEIEAHNQIQLAEFKEKEKKNVELERKRLRQEVGQARTYPELLKIAYDRGYKPAWAQMVWKGRKR